MIDDSKGRVADLCKTVIRICTVPFLYKNCSYIATESPQEGNYT